MKKFLLLAPVIALAGLGTYLTTSPDVTSPSKAENTISNPQTLFLESEHDLRQIIRHGDAQFIERVQTSLSVIENKITAHGKNGYAIEKLLNVLHVYQNDSSMLVKTFTPLLEQVHQSDQFEQTHQKSFQSSLEQIGLYELKTAYSDLESLRKNYIKEPTNKTKLEYETLHIHIKQTINELYLDASIEKPLYAYLDNHKDYFDVISNAYTTLHYDRINRLRTNGYAIKTELQILPSS